MSHLERCLEKWLKLQLHVELSAFIGAKIPTEQGSGKYPRRPEFCLQRSPGFHKTKVVWAQGHYGRILNLPWHEMLTIAK